MAAAAVHAVGVPGQGRWETTLLPRDLDGDALNGPEAFYDTAIDVTWLRDAGDVNSYKNRDTANTWANSLPEPQTYALMLVGLAALGLRRRLR